MTDRLILSPVAYANLRRDATSAKFSPFTQFVGLPIEESNLFPTLNACGRCAGSGEGDDSTYCGNCRGAGTIRTEGMMLHGLGNMTLITTPLPRKFEPRASFTVPPRKLCRGLV